MVADLAIEPFDSLPGDITALADAEAAEGHALVRRLVEEWADGSNRFDRPGEIALEARLGGTLVAVGGLNRDPYLDDPAVGRLRHVYVAPEGRRRGVGRLLVMTLVDHARQHFTRVRLRTVTPEGSTFYGALGFDEIDEPHGTHQITF